MRISEQLSRRIDMKEYSVQSNGKKSKNAEEIALINSVMSLKDIQHQRKAVEERQVNWSPVPNRLEN